MECAAYRTWGGVLGMKAITQLSERRGRAQRICFDLMAIVAGQFVSGEISLVAYDLRMAAIEDVRVGELK
jgi:hypothetical protein